MTVAAPQGDCNLRNVMNLDPRARAATLGAEGDPVMSAYYLKISGVKGSSQVAPYKDWIEVESFSTGHSRAPTGRTSGAGDAKALQEIVIAKYEDSSSPSLVSKAAKGDHLGRVILANAKADPGSAFAVIVMEDVIVSSLQMSGVSGGGRPLEAVGLNFRSLEFMSWAQYAVKLGIEATVQKITNWF